MLSVSWTTVEPVRAVVTPCARRSGAPSCWTSRGLLVQEDVRADQRPYDQTGVERGVEPSVLVAPVGPLGDPPAQVQRPAGFGQSSANAPAARS